MNDTCQRLPKSERLHGRDAIQEVFGSGEQLFIYPFKCHLRLFPCNKGSLRFMVSVPKRNIKKAVDRNHIKRRTRESWRRNNHKLKTELIEKQMCIDLGLVFIGKSLSEIKEAEAKIILILQRLSVFHANHKSNSVRHPHNDH